MGKGKGYVLPAGDAYTEELRCALVFYPARDEYLYALMGSLRFLGMWLAWERDELKRGKDAAAAWRFAIEQTEACMGMCDDLLERLDSLPRLEQLMEQLLAAQCCAPALVSDTVTTDLTIGGDPPATWGDGVIVSDYEHWESLLCGAAHAYVDLLISDAEWLASLTGAVVIGVGLIAALLGALSGAGLILAIGYGTLTSVSAGLLASILAGDHVGVPASLEAARADIVCAIVHGGAAQLAAAVEEAVGPLAWAALYSWVDYDSAWATMAAGGNAEGTLPASTRTDCDCTEPLVAGMNIVGIVLTSDGTDSPAPIHCDITRDGSAVTLVGNPLSTTTAYGIHWARRSGIPMTVDRDPLTEWPGSATRAAFRITCIARDNVGDVFRWHTSDGSTFGVNLAPGESYLVYVNSAPWTGYDWASEADTIVNLPSGDNNFDEQSCDVYTGRASAPGGTAGGTWRIEQYWWLS